MFTGGTGFEPWPNVLGFGTSSSVLCVLCLKSWGSKGFWAKALTVGGRLS